MRQYIISHSATPNISLERIVDLCYNVYEEGGGCMAESKLRDLSMDFSVKVIKMCDSIKGITRL